MYKLQLNNFANCPVIIISNEKKFYESGTISILRTKNDVDAQIDFLEQENSNREQILKDLKVLRSELKEQFMKIYQD